MGLDIPGRVYENKELEALVQNYDPAKSGVSLSDWVYNHYGIRRRNWAADDEFPSDYGTKAAQKAIADAGLEAQDIDLLVLNTAFGDYIQPTTATLIQQNLGMRPDSFALEINMPCAGPIYSITTAYNFLLGGKYKTALVVGADKMSRLTDPRDFIMGTLFGDGAGALVLGQVPDGGIVDYYLASKGEGPDHEEHALVIPGGFARNPTSAETIDQNMHVLRMHGKQVEGFVDSCMKDIVEHLLPPHRLTIYDLAYLIPHQAAYNTVIHATRELGIPDDIVCFSLEDLANTSAASIFITLIKHRHKMKPGDKILLAGMGGGLNWGGILYEFPA